MNQHVCVVTADGQRGERYGVALAPISCRHISRWRPERIDETVAVVLFDPEVVERSTIVASRSMHDRSYWIVAIGADTAETVKRVEQAIAGRRFEATVEARFDALAAGANEIPPVMIPNSLDSATFATLYAGV